MTYRPITDVWFLARAKLQGGAKYYGAYLGGFPERARVLIGCSIADPVLHVCGGMAKLYPYKGGFGPKDATLDLDPETKPDYLCDAREYFPAGWRGILMDPPYSPDEATNYAPGRDAYPSPNALMRNAMAALEVGGRVGLLHYQLPALPKNAKFIAAVGVISGFNNRIRCFSVYERIS